MDGPVNAATKLIYLQQHLGHVDPLSDNPFPLMVTLLSP
jgi:hypothetical protein